MNLIGVYSIINTINGKRYVGSTAVSFAERMKQHETLLRQGKHTSRHLQGAWNKYGSEPFEFCVELICPADEVVKMEQHFLDLYRPFEESRGYNILPRADSHLGAKRTDESKKKMGAWKRSPELCAKLSESAKKNFTPEAQRKMIEGRKRAGFSEETRAKMRAAHANKTPETLLKMSMAQLGKKRSPESVEKVAAAHRGRKHSLEWVEAIRRGNVGKKRSAESKANIKAGQPKRLVSYLKTVAARKSAEFCLN